MPSNIEIKAKVENMARLEQLAREISDTPCEVLEQEDTFFNTPQGRLKLRVFPNQTGSLIYYDRPDAKGAKQSDYQIYDTSDPEVLRMLLDKALGSKIVVRKTRHLYISGQTRIHLDWVEGLGTFMELEVLLQDSQDTHDGYKIAKELMTKLEIQESQLLSGAYADMLLK